jgi:predicted N-acyltransferase
MPRPPRAVQFALAERLAHLDATAWDALTRDASVFMRRPFLSALEAELPDNVSPRYALVYLGDEAVAAMSLQLVRVEGRSAIATKNPLNGVAQLVDERALVLGNLAAWGETGLVIKPGADASLVWAEALRLVDRLRRFEKSEGVVNVSFVKDASGLENETVLRAQGYQRAPSGPDMTLALDPAWSSLDDYLACLASKRRRAVKKTFEELETAGYVARRLSLDDLRANEARLDALYGQVWANAEVRPLRLSGAFFVELQRRLGEDCVVLGLERDGRLDGFGVCLRSGATSVGYYLGFDKTIEAPLYLRLLVAILEQAITWRCTSVSMGRTAEEPKARLGAVAGNAGLWVKHRTPPLNWAVGAILGTLEAPEIAAHKVFRE